MPHQPNVSTCPIRTLTDASIVSEKGTHNRFTRHGGAKIISAGATSALPDALPLLGSIEPSTTVVDKSAGYSASTPQRHWDSARTRRYHHREYLRLCGRLVTSGADVKEGETPTVQPNSGAGTPACRSHNLPRVDILGNRTDTCVYGLGTYGFAAQEAQLLAEEQKARGRCRGTHAGCGEGGTRYEGDGQGRFPSGALEPLPLRRHAPAPVLVPSGRSRYTMATVSVPHPGNDLSIPPLTMQRTTPAYCHTGGHAT